jgi:hypothetical protein
MEKKLCIIAQMSEVKTASDGRNYRTLRVQEMPYEVIFNPMLGREESVPMTRTPLTTGFNVWAENINGSVNPVFNAYKVNQAVVGQIEKVTTEPYLLMDDQGDVVAATATTVFVNWDSSDREGYAKQRELELKNSGRVIAKTAATEAELDLFLNANRDAFLRSIENRAAGINSTSQLDVIDANDLDAIVAGATTTSEETPKQAGKPAKPAVENLAD